MVQFLSSLIENYGLLGIFIGTFLSYSILPLPADALIVLGVSFFNPYAVLFVSLLGSTLGSISNYFIGLKGIRTFLKKRYSKKEKRAGKMFRKWGPVSIVLFSWLPIIGDPLFVIAGTLKMNFWKFLLYSTLGKIWYLILLIWFGSFLTSLF